MDLFIMKDFLDDLVETFRTVLDLECTIINANPIKRISGTGIYKFNHNEENWNKSYAIKVIEEKKSMTVIDTTDKSWVMVGDRINYYSLVLHPILLDNMVEGVIVLASLNEKQQKMIVEKSEQLVSYLDKISLLISSKFKQDILMSKLTVINSQLKKIFESVTDGIILYSKEEKILQMNDKARDMLQANNLIVHNKLKDRILSIAKKSIEKKKSIDKHLFLKIQGKNYSLMVKSIYSDTDEILIIISEFENYQKIATSNDYELNDFASHSIIGENNKILSILDSIDKLSGNGANILLMGESGTGKELFARTIHARSDRREHPFVGINCAAIPDMLLESELFGYEEGAFTGAKKGGKLGKFLLANQGTIFLDEIGDMPLYLQAKLLRVLDEMKVDRIGSNKLIDIDVQIIAATNKNLEKMVIKKEFREDLFYRLSVIPIQIPPLRDRKDDILLLANYFIERYNERFKKNIKGFSKDVLEIMEQYEWPGNIRELENSIQYMVSFENSKYIQLLNIPHKLKESIITSNPLKENDVGESTILNFDRVKGKSLRELLSIREQEILVSYVREYEKPIKKKDVKKICSELGISVATFYRKYKMQSHL